jgi:hypothetical protein
MARYLISMAIRTACVLLVFVVHGPFRWVFAAGAIVLPYIAVILANASGRHPAVPDSSAMDHRGLAPSAPAPDGVEPVVLTGVVETPRVPPDPER